MVVVIQGFGSPSRDLLKIMIYGKSAATKWERRDGAVKESISSVTVYWQ